MGMTLAAFSSEIAATGANVDVVVLFIGAAVGINVGGRDIFLLIIVGDNDDVIGVLLVVLETVGLRTNNGEIDGVVVELILTIVGTSDAAVSLLLLRKRLGILDGTWDEFVELLFGIGTGAGVTTTTTDMGGSLVEELASLDDFFGLFFINSSTTVVIIAATITANTRQHKE